MLRGNLQTDAYWKKISEEFYDYCKLWRTNPKSGGYLPKGSFLR